MTNIGMKRKASLIPTQVHRVSKRYKQDCDAALSQALDHMLQLNAYDQSSSTTEPQLSEEEMNCDSSYAEINSVLREARISATQERLIIPQSEMMDSTPVAQHDITADTAAIQRHYRPINKWLFGQQFPSN